MTKKIISIIFIITLTLFTGCTDATEVSDIVIVAGVGLDRTDDGQILISLLLPVTRSANFGGLLTSGSGQKESTVLVSEKGKNIMEAYRKIEKKLSRKVFLSQNQAIFIGENLAREGISDIIDFFYRNPESHLSDYMFFSKGQATDILRMHSRLERSIVEKFIKGQKLETSLKINFKDFLNMITEEGIEPIAPQLIFVPVEVDSQSTYMTVAIDGAAVLHKNKLVGWINAEEARGTLWLRDEVRMGVITTNIPDEKKGGRIGLEITKSKTKINPIINDNGVEMEVKIYAKGRINENSSKLDLTNPENMHFVERKVSESIKKRIELSLEKVQKQLKSDVYGFGTAVYRKYPKKWNSFYKERWDNEFPKVIVKITCEVSIPEIGLEGKVLIDDNEKNLK